MFNLGKRFGSMTAEEKREKIQNIKPYAIVVVIPILFTTLFSYMFGPIFVTDIPVVIYDMDQSAASREVVDYFYDSDVLAITESLDSQKEIEEAILTNEICGAIILPEDFGKDLNGKKGAEAVVLMDNTNFMYGNNLMSAINTIFNTVNAGIQMKILEGGSQVPYQAEQSVYTLNIAERILYNPQLGYFYYLYAGLLSIFVQQVFLAAVVPMLIEEKHRIKNEKFLDTGEKIRFDFSIMVPRIFLVTGLSIISMMASLHIAMSMTGFPMRGNILILLLFQVVFLAAMTGIALVISAVFEQVSHAAQFTMLLTVPTFLTCGYAWNEYLMAPGFAAVIKAIWPLYYFANPMKDVLLKGVGLEMLLPYLKGCIIFAMVWIPFGLVCYGRKIKLLREV